MSRTKDKKQRIIFFAKVCRFSPIIMALLSMLAGKRFFLCWGLGLWLYALCLFLGLKFRRKLLGCAYQIAANKEASPYNISWDSLKSYIYKDCIVFAVLGLIMLVFHFWLMNLKICL